MTQVTVCCKCARWSACRMVANWKCYQDIKILCSLLPSLAMDHILYVAADSVLITVEKHSID